MLMSAEVLDTIPALILAVIAGTVAIMFLWYCGTYSYPFYVYVPMTLLLLVVSIQLFAVLPYDVMVGLRYDGCQLADIVRIVVRVCYWGNVGLSWLIFPVFVCACLYRYAITKAKAYWYMIKDNFVWYILVVLFCVACLIVMYFTAEFTAKNLEPLCMAMTNAYGLVLIVFFMGHGIIELPRQILRNADPKRRLRTMLSALHASAEEAAQATVNSGLASEGCLQLRDTLDESLEPLILRPLELRQNEFARNSRVRVLPEYCYDMKGPERVFVGMPKMNFRRSSVSEIENFLYLCDDCVKTVDEFNYEVRTTVSQLEWAMNEVIAYSRHDFRAVFRKVARIMLGVFLILLNCLICWAEAVLIIGKSEYGPFYMLSHLNVPRMVLMTLFTPCVLAYMIFVMGWSVSKVRLAKKYFKFWPADTSETSMYFWLCVMSRLTPALVYHYILQLEAETTETFKLYNRMKDVIFIGNTMYSTYMPACMFVMMILFAFYVWDKLLDAIGVQKFHFETDEPPISEVGRGLELMRSMRPDLAHLMDSESIRSIGGDAPMLSTFSTNFPSCEMRYTK